jgi:glycosyltransferase involved in cell wall biosynthesis
MKITVGIPVYNRKSRIAACIDSVLTQQVNSAFTFSVLVVDNASTDGTREVLEGYASNEQVRVVYNESNVGMAPNWTKVFAEADADYIYLLHSDDFLLPGTLQKVADFVTEHPDCDFGFGAVHIDTGKSIRKDIFKLKGQATGIVPNSWLLEEYFYKASHPCPPQTWFVKKGVIEAMGGFITNNMCCDFNMSFKIVASNYTIGYINESLSMWVLHDENIGGGDIRKHKKDLLAAIADIQENAVALKLDTSKLAGITDWVAKEELLKFLKIGDRAEASLKAADLTAPTFDKSSLKELLMWLFKYTKINLIRPFYKVKTLLDTL